MSIELTQEQKDQLTSWSQQRDSLLREVSNLNSTKERLEEYNKEISEAITDAEGRLNQIYGKIEESIKNENELYSMTPKEVVDLRVEKSSLQSEVTALKEMIIMLHDQKDSLEKDVVRAAELLKPISDSAGLTDKIIGDATEVNRKNVTELEQLIGGVKLAMKEVININSSVVSQTNDVIKDLPRVFLEVKRQSLEREIINKHK